MPDINEPMLTPGEAARRLGVSTVTLSRWTKKDPPLIRSLVTPNGQHRYPESEVERIRQSRFRGAALGGAA